MMRSFNCLMVGMIKTQSDECKVEYNMQTKYIQQNMAHTHQKPNLLDDINLFPPKEEGRVPDGRRVLSERKKKPRQVNACVCSQGKLFLPFVLQVTRKSVLFVR